MFIDLKDSYNAHLRARRIKRHLACLSILMAVALLSVSLGVLIAAADSALLSITAALVLGAAAWSASYLLTRH